MKRTRFAALTLALALFLSAGAPCAQAQESAILYIGTRETEFTGYTIPLEGALTPEALIAGIQELTGWKLTLAEPVTMGKGGMSVCFAEDSALFAGPPDPQNAGFEVLDAHQLAQTLLDSVQKTLQMNFTLQGGDPEALDVFYYMEGDQPLTLPDIDRTWPIDEPYLWENSR